MPPDGAVAAQAPSPLHNDLLAALPADGRARLLSQLELVTLPLGKTLYAPGDAVRHAYFPVDCIISLLALTPSGASVEIAVVGAEGVAGVSLFMGGESATREAIVRSAGYAYRVGAPWLVEEFNRHGDLLVATLRYTQVLITQIAQTAVCNRHHSVEQQLCRTLLMSLDRLRGNRLDLTQEFIAHMLGVRREGVTDAAGKLQKAGAIAYSRGHITVQDRGKLERLSCECYTVVQRESRRLLSRNLRAPPRARPLAPRAP